MTVTKPTNKRFIVLAFLCVLAFLTYFDRVCIVRAQNDISRDLGLSSEQMGMILSAFWLAYALFEIPAGWLGDRYGSRVALTRIVVAWSLFTVLSGCATGMWTLLACRLLFGAGEAGAFPNMARVQANWLPAATRGRAGGLLWLLARWGGAFSPAIFGALLSAFDSESFRGFLGQLGLPEDLAAWRVAFWAAGLVGVVWCVAFYRWFRDDPADKPSVNEAELELIRGDSPPRHESHSMPGYLWKALFSCPSLWALGMLYIFASFGWSFFVSWMPKYFEEVHAVSMKNSEWASAGPLFFGGIACLVGGMLSDWLVRRTGRKWLGRALFPFVGYSIAAVAMFCIPYADIDDVIILLCIAGAGHDFGQGANWATIVDIGGRYSGISTGFINMVGNSGNWLQPPIGARIFQAFGWNVLMVVYASAFLGAAAMWLVINPSKTFYEGREEA